MDGIEVWNSAWSPANERAVELWHTLLVGGNRKFAVASTDFHRGGNIAYCGHLFTEPELQPDGSLAFWQLSLTCESDDFKGWAGEETIVPDTATVTTVRLVPTENGWRVDALELPN